MERLVEAELKEGRASRILAEFVREYDILSEPHLVRISAVRPGSVFNSSVGSVRR